MNRECGTSKDIPSTDGWPEYAKFVLAELSRLNECYDDLEKNLNNHVKTNESRITKIETILKYNKYTTGIIISLMSGVFIMVLAQVVGAVL
jgi:hypothetical protein